MLVTRLDWLARSTHALPNILDTVAEGTTATKLVATLTNGPALLGDLWIVPIGRASPPPDRWSRWSSLAMNLLANDLDDPAAQGEESSKRSQACAGINAR